MKLRKVKDTGICAFLLCSLFVLSTIGIFILIFMYGEMFSGSLELEVMGLVLVLFFAYWIIWAILAIFLEEDHDWVIQPFMRAWANSKRKKR